MAKRNENLHLFNKIHMQKYQVTGMKINNDILPRLITQIKKNRKLIVSHRGKYTAYQIFIP